MGIGAAQNLYDEAVLHGKIIRIHRLSRHKSFRISLDQGCAYYTQLFGLSGPLL